MEKHYTLTEFKELPIFNLESRANNSFKLSCIDIIFKKWEVISIEQYYFTCVSAEVNSDGNIDYIFEFSTYKIEDFIKSVRKIVNT